MMGHKAVELLISGASNRVVAMRDGRITDIDITEGLSMERVFDKNLYQIAMDISI